VSVINQMLKDLDQRTPEQGQTPTPAITAQPPSTLKIVLISVVVLLTLNGLGFYIFDLLGSTAKSKSVELKEHIPEKTSEQVQDKNLKLVIEPLSKTKSTPVIIEEESVESVTAAQASPEKEHSSVALKETKTITKTVESKVAAPKAVRMSVSRRQLTSTELVAQKLVKAEKAVNLNEISKAEQLFEEILIIEPEHKLARKKLAALWFGRKSYTQAVNLLSQGIAIYRHDGEFRLLKARIHLSQGQHEAAFYTLKPLATFEQEEYQVTLANIAQKIEQYSDAISAYQVLIKMQPYSGRWHLGLAIVYDKNSQFPLAVNEYALALTKTDLSASSAKFAQQRMQALRE